MAMFGLRTVFTNIAIKDVHETEMAGFVNFNTLASWNEMYSVSYSIKKNNLFKVISSVVQYLFL